MTAAPKEPRPIVTAPEAYDYTPFPAGVLPSPVKEFVRGAARSIGCDASMVALPTIAAIGTAIGNTRRARIKRDWTEPPIFWTATVAPSGTGKSPAFTAALRPLYRWQTNELDRHSQMMELHEQEVEAYDHKYKQWKEKNRDPEQRLAKPKAPTARRCIVSDITIETLTTVLSENPRGVLAANDELAAWMKSFDAYRQGRGGDAAKWCTLWQAGTLITDRKSDADRTVHVPMAAASITGTIQPGTLGRTLGLDLIENGLAARLLLAKPPRQVRLWTDDEIAPHIQAAMDRLFEALLDLQFNQAEDGGPVPVDVPFSHEGKDAWIQFYNQWKSDDAVTTGEMSAVSAKLVSYCARFSLLIHMVRVAAGDSALSDPEAIDPQSVACAEQLVRWFGQEARRIYFGLHEDENQQRVRELVEMIRAKGGTITVRDLMRAKCSRYPTADEARGDLLSLVDAGFGNFVMTETIKAGRPSDVFTLYPQYIDPVDMTKTLTEAAEGILSVSARSSSDSEQSKEKIEEGLLKEGLKK